MEAALDVRALTKKQKKKKKDYFYASCIVVAASLEPLRHQEPAAVVLVRFPCLN